MSHQKSAEERIPEKPKAHKKNAKGKEEDLVSLMQNSTFNNYIVRGR